MGRNKKKNNQTVTETSTDLSKSDEIELSHSTQKLSSENVDSKTAANENNLESTKNQEECIEQTETSNITSASTKKKRKKKKNPAQSDENDVSVVQSSDINNTDSEVKCQDEHTVENNPVDSGSLKKIPKTKKKPVENDKKNETTIQSNDTETEEKYQDENVVERNVIDVQSGSSKRKRNKKKKHSTDQEESTSTTQSNDFNDAKDENIVEHNHNIIKSKINSSDIVVEGKESPKNNSLGQHSFINDSHTLENVSVEESSTSKHKKNKRSGKCKSEPSVQCENSASQNQSECNKKENNMNNKTPVHVEKNKSIIKQAEESDKNCKNKDINKKEKMALLQKKLDDEQNTKRKLKISKDKAQISSEGPSVPDILHIDKSASSNMQEEKQMDGIKDKWDDAEEDWDLPDNTKCQSQPERHDNTFYKDSQKGSSNQWRSDSSYEERNFNRNYSKDSDFDKSRNMRRGNYNSYSKQYAGSSDRGSYDKRRDYNNRSSRSYEKTYDRPREGNTNWKENSDGTQGRSNKSYHSYKQGRSSSSGKGKSGESSGSLTFTESIADLFTAPDSYSLAHCVAEDMRMGAGIAIQFKQMFKRVDELLSQRARSGGLAVLDDEKIPGRFIYYLVTKPTSNGKPTMGTLKKSLLKLKDHCIQNNVKQLAMPRIGCGLDRLEWYEVEELLKDIFGDVQMEIAIYNYQDDTFRDNSNTQMKLPSPFIKNMPMSLVDMETQTGLLFLCYEDKTVTTEMNQLNAKYNFIQEFQLKKRLVGDVVHLEKKCEYLYGLVISKTKSDTIDYKVLATCLRNLRKMNNKHKCYYFGIQAFIFEDDEITMEKFVTLVKNIFGKIEFWICWSEDLKRYMPMQDSS